MKMIRRPQADQERGGQEVGRECALFSDSDSDSDSALSESVKLCLSLSLCLHVCV
eukprot:COSAG01_NODE_55730_length_323_cov_0.691964_2_plen_54_part_01